MRRLLLCLLLLSLASRVALAQTDLKFNGLTALVAVPQIGIEWVTGPRTSFQLDVTTSFWRSVGGAPMEFVIIVPEWRHHFREGHLGPYVGMHAGLTGFHVQKWDHRNTDRYQEGAGVMFGGTFGYKSKIGDRVALDYFVGGGTVQSKYKGYLLSTGVRYDGEDGWNESGEWAPYRAGVMFTYRIR